MSAVSRAVLQSLRAQQRAAGESVTYRRGPLGVGLKAVPTFPQGMLIGEDGQTLATTQHKDWLVIAAELLLDGSRITPVSGDLVEWTDPQGVLHRYEVGSIAGSEVWHWMDAAHVGLRIHSLLTGTES